MAETQRALFVRIKGLLMLAVDLIDRECQLGKYAATQIVNVAEGDSIAGAYSPVTVESRTDIMPQEQAND